MIRTDRLRGPQAQHVQTASRARKCGHRGPSKHCTWYELPSSCWRTSARSSTETILQAVTYEAGEWGSDGGCDKTHAASYSFRRMPHKPAGALFDVQLLQELIVDTG